MLFWRNERIYGISLKQCTPRMLSFVTITRKG
jgi:hypothetical protein